MSSNLHPDYEAPLEVGQELHAAKQEAAKVKGPDFGEQRMKPKDEAARLMADGNEILKTMGPKDAGRPERMRNMLKLMREKGK